MVARLVGNSRSPGIPGDLLVEYLDDAVAVVSAADRVIRANRAFAQLLGASPQDFVDHSVFEVGDGALADPRVAQHLAAARRDPGHTETWELDRELPRGGRKILRISARAVDAAPKGPVTLLVVHDATQERQDVASHRLEVVELTHRMKNSLQVLAAFVAREARRASSDDREGYLAIQRRIAAVGALYDVLSRSGECAYVEAVVMLNALADGLRATLLGGAPGVEIEVRAAPVRLSSREAELTGLLVNELATNAIKHAFPERQGRVVIALVPADDATLTLSVSDDGVGLKEDHTHNRGTAVVASLVAGLGGVLSTITGPGGATFEVRFPWRSISADHPAWPAEGH